MRIKHAQLMYYVCINVLNNLIYKYILLHLIILHRHPSGSPLSYASMSTHTSLRNHVYVVVEIDSLDFSTGSIC